MIKRLISWLRNFRRYVILDVTDSSVTLSRALFRIISRDNTSDDPPRVFVFYSPAHQMYGFIINPEIEQPTQLADIQYNTRHRCLGFETLNPTVARILYDYQAHPVDRPVRLTVTRHYLPGKRKIYYLINRPGKYIRFNNTRQGRSDNNPVRNQSGSMNREPN